MSTHELVMSSAHLWHHKASQRVTLRPLKSKVIGVKIAAAAVKIAAAAKASSLQPQPHVKARMNPRLQT